MDGIKELKRLARFRPLPLPSGFTYRQMKMETEEIEARRKYIRQKLSPYSDKLPYFRFDNDTIDTTLIIEADEHIMVSVCSVKWKAPFDYVIEKASWDKTEEKKT